MTDEHKAKIKAGREAARLAKLNPTTSGITSTSPLDKLSGTTMTANSPVPPVGEKVKEETVEIKRSDFDKMMKQMESQAKDIALLYKTADKSRIAKELNKEGENLIKQAKVSTWDDTGRFIIGWKLITNRCEVVMGKWIEEQSVSIVFEDGEIMTVPLLEFYRKTLKKVEGDIISRTEEADKSIIFKLQFPTGKIILLGSQFVN